MGEGEGRGTNRHIYIDTISLGRFFKTCEYV